MSTIEKMNILGIRSFGPEEQDKQTIHFFKPLTLILGPNGTGKTTIIECLKYMTTGVMPPGATKGGAFIHDPKIAHEREVRGQVRLQFRDISQKPVIVQRSLTATQKAKKVEMKTLDGVITRLNAAGEKQSINSKCADLDREMITSLGVSKPVLENVIFCHQEEANWPLSEGKQLKEKFDAIFASTRYVKALDSIKKTKKEQDDKLKMYRNDVQYLKQHKEKAHQLECDLAEQEAKLEASKESVNKVNSQLKPIEEKMNKIDEQSAEIFGIQNKITQYGSEKKQIEKHAEELQDQIENEFQGTDEELKSMLSDFEDKLKERKRTLEEFEDRQNKLSRQSEKLDREKSAILVEVGRLEQEAERQEENVSKRDTLIKQFADEYSFDGLTGAITDEKYKLFLKNMQRKLETMVEETRQTKTDFEEREGEIQQKIDELRDNKTKLEQNDKIKREMMLDNREKIKEINRKLSAIEASGGRLDQIKRELKRHEHDLQTQESSVNTDELKQEIAELSKEKSKMEAKISELNSEMNRLHLQSSAQAELDMLKKDKASKEENIRRLKAKREDTVKYLLNHAPGKNIRGELEDYISNQNEDVKKCSAKMNQIKNTMSKMETERKMGMEQLKKKEAELKGLEERVYNVCGSQNFDEGLSTIQEKMEKVRDQRGSLLGAQHFFKKYAKDLEKDDPCCPLCHRGFDTQQDVRELVLELKEKLRMVPSKLKTADEEIDECQEKYDALMQLKPLRENMEKLEESEIPQLKSSLKKTQDEIHKQKEDLTNIEEELKIKEDDEAMAKQIQPDIVMMDRYFGDVSELDKKIAMQAAKLSGGDSGRTLQMVIDEKEDLQVKVDSSTRSLDHKRQKLADHSEQVQILRATINSLKEEKFGIESDLQQRIKLEEDKGNLESENTMHEQDIKDTAEKLRPIQSKMDRLRTEKEDLVKKKEEKLETAKAEVEIVKGHASQVKNINQDIKSYNQSGKASKLEENQADKERIEKKMAAIEEELKDIVTNIDKLRKDLSTQKVRELDLQNNLNLRNKQKEIEKISRKIVDLESKLGDLDVAYLDRERRRLQREMENLTKQRHTAEGRQTELENQIRAVKKELQTDMYKGAEEKYRNKMIDLRTTELANGDLEKYYHALDKAIMNYHNMKMSEINKIIRDLWRQTYRGQDIETIEIRSDEDDSAAMKTRKTYNYRVVMIKPGDAVIDMRGRCSAGQKVLASLIIRLALAETFCLNCGILALDEPTTNLDRENIESLAGALVEIIKGRIHQRNFQLVIITHDEDFVELLGRSEYVDYFFKVSKNQYGCSRLTRAEVAELSR
ncbi:DNA repair protein RAD50-like isoform X1 [Ruditapes philippinarum]|uniref:DNA repair protein RAD50-like isoform X1 n=1 Tax=Ruditapes philippinarum TaxID=129788 RepID=UPI00295AEE30|nr:DNA repair protein RAD50-like isoform X1 [Ruditapes philippinarum]XP_060561863.1 DNA repair protein RAD50-like isoform X1 [Ruditapes philippinarum]